MPCRARLAPPCSQRFGPSPCPDHYDRHLTNMAFRLRSLSYALDRLLTSLASHSPQGDGGCSVIPWVAPKSAFRIGPPTISPACFPLFRHIFLGVRQKLVLTAPGLGKPVALPAFSLEKWTALCKKQSQTGRLIALHSSFLHLPVGRQGHYLAMMPLPSDNTFATIII